MAHSKRWPGVVKGHMHKQRIFGGLPPKISGRIHKSRASDVECAAHYVGLSLSLSMQAENRAHDGSLAVFEVFALGLPTSARTAPCA